jgi:hypothetical protein
MSNYSDLTTQADPRNRRILVVANGIVDGKAFRRTAGCGEATNTTRKCA